MASFLYTTFKRDIMNGTIDLDNDTLYVMLLASTYTTVSAAGTTHDFRNDITDYEASGTGYTAGGVALTGSHTVTADTTNNYGVWDTSYDPSWTSATVTARFAVVYVSTGAATTDNLICCYDFGSDQTATNGTFTIQWSTAGLMRLS